MNLDNYTCLVYHVCLKITPTPSPAPTSTSPPPKHPRKKTNSRKKTDPIFGLINPVSMIRSLFKAKKEQQLRRRTHFVRAPAHPRPDPEPEPIEEVLRIP